MRRVTTVAGGYLLGFVLAEAAISAVVLAGIGIGGHIIAVRRPGTASVFGFDPSQVAAQALVPGGSAIVLAIVFVLIARRLGRAQR